MSAPATFSLGGFGPTLIEQGLGAWLDADDLIHFQRDDEAISRLFQRGLIPYAAHVKAREKLGAKIRAAAHAYKPATLSGERA